MNALRIQHAGTELKRPCRRWWSGREPLIPHPRDPSDNPATKRGFSLAITVALRGHACAVTYGTAPQSALTHTRQEPGHSADGCRLGGVVASPLSGPMQKADAKRKKRPIKTDPEQFERFLQAARSRDVNESLEDFAAKFQKIVPPKRSSSPGK